MKHLPNSFVWRRLHSLSGVFLVLFLFEHLLTNSEAALFFGEDGHSFVRIVNLIHDLPYLPVIEVSLLAFPILIHALWGIHYLSTSKMNSFSSQGNKPSLNQYPRNHAFTWQRITSWILLIGLTAHVIQMRFFYYPTSVPENFQTSYITQLKLDSGLYTLADRLNTQLYDNIQIEKIAHNFEQKIKGENINLNNLRKYTPPLSPQQISFDPKQKKALTQLQLLQQRDKWLQTVQSFKSKKGEVLAIAPSFGTATLLAVREVFKSPLMMILYTLFVLCAAFHAFNGLWTFLITWGIIATEHSQRIAKRVTCALMALVCFLGLAAIWGTYWINLKF